MNNDLQVLQNILFQKGWLNQNQWNECVNLYQSLGGQMPFVDMLRQFRYVDTDRYIQLKTITKSPTLMINTPSTSKASSKEQSEKRYFQGGNYGRYNIDRELGQGGMGRVMLAFDRDLRRKAAMKICLHTNDDGRLRFVREAQIGSQLEHPNIAPVYDAGLGPQKSLYFTMKYIEGIPFSTVLEQVAKGNPAFVKNYPLSRLISIFMKVLEGMGYAHAKGIIHRDLKPDNIMIGQFGEVLIVDWGLAKLYKVEKISNKVKTKMIDFSDFQSQVQAKTMDGAVAGTPGYMAPEQALGELELMRPESDIYALGIILFEILAMKRAYSGRDVMQILFKTARGEFLPPRQVSPERKIPRALEAICLTAMEYSIEDRYGSTEEMLIDLQSFMGDQEISVYTPPIWSRAMRFLRHHAASLLVLIVIMAMITGFTYLLSEANKRELVQQKQKNKNWADKVLAEKAKNKALKAQAEAEKKRRELVFKINKRQEAHLQAQAPYQIARNLMGKNIKFKHLRNVVIPKLKEALKIYPHYFNAHIELTKIYFYMEMTKEGMGQLLKLLQTLPLDMQRKVSKMMIRLMVLSNASQGHLQSFDLPPGFDSVRPKIASKVYWDTLKALLYFQMKQLGRAEEMIDEILKLDEGKTWENYFLKARILSAKGQNERAMDLYNFMEKEYPQLPYVYISRANIYIHSVPKQLDKAYKELKKLQQIDPSCHLLWTSLGILNGFKAGTLQVHVHPEKFPQYIAHILASWRYSRLAHQIHSDNNSNVFLQEKLLHRMAHWMGELTKGFKGLWENRNK